MKLEGRRAPPAGREASLPTPQAPGHQLASSPAAAPGLTDGAEASGYNVGRYRLIP